MKNVIYIVNIVTICESLLNVTCENKIAFSYEEAKKIFEEEKNIAISSLEESNDNLDLKEVIREDNEYTFQAYDNDSSLGVSILIDEINKNNNYIINTF